MVYNVVVVVQSQGVRIVVKAFYRVHELHYQLKSRTSDKLHNNLCCYNFVYRKDQKFTVLAYRTKWTSDWTKEWFLYSSRHQEERGVQLYYNESSYVSFKLKIICKLGDNAKKALTFDNSVVSNIGIQDLLQEFLMYRVFPTHTGWKMLKPKKGVKALDLGMLTTLPYEFKRQLEFKCPYAGWLETI
jgi:hypothetical protein